MVVTPRASSALVLDGDDVIFTRQARFAVDDIVLEIVKGGAEPHEDGLSAAQRELREELGFVAARWNDLGIIYEIPSIMHEPIMVYLARDLSVVPTELEDVETIEAVRMPFSEALLAAGRGTILDAVTTVALFRAAQLLQDEHTSP